MKGKYKGGVPQVSKEHLKAGEEGGLKSKRKRDIPVSLAGD